MADRAFHDAQTQGVRHIDLVFSVAGATVTTNAPTFVEGDTKGASAGSYITCTKVATGKYRFTTKDPYLGAVSFSANMCMASPDSNSYPQMAKPSQNANGTWQFDVWVLHNAAGTFSLTDLTAGDQLHVQLRMRNSSSTP